MLCIWLLWVSLSICVCTACIGLNSFRHVRICVDCLHEYMQMYVQKRKTKATTTRKMMHVKWRGTVCMVACVWVESQGRRELESYYLRNNLSFRRQYWNQIHIRTWWQCNSLYLNFVGVRFTLEEFFKRKCTNVNKLLAN